MVKKFHSFEYRKILLNNAAWRCPLYQGTIYMSWIKLLTISIFELPNKSPSFLLSHSASKKLLNVYDQHSLSDKLWLQEFILQISVLNDRETPESLGEFSTGPAKSSSSHRESTSDLVTESFGKIVVRMDTKENRFSIRNTGCSPTTTLAKHVLWYASTCHRGRKSVKDWNPVVCLHKNNSMLSTCWLLDQTVRLFAGGPRFETSSANGLWRSRTYVLTIPFVSMKVSFVIITWKWKTYQILRNILCWDSKTSLFN